MKSWRMHNEEMKARVVELHNAGAPAHEIRKALGLPKTTVQSWTVGRDRAQAARPLEPPVTLPSVGGRSYAYVHGALVVEESRA